MTYIFEEYKIEDGAHFIEAILHLEPEEEPSADCPFYRNSIDVVNITNFQLDPFQSSIIVKSAGGGYSIPIEMIQSVTNFGSETVSDPTAEDVYDFFSKAKGYY